MALRAENPKVLCTGKGDQKGEKRGGKRIEDIRLRLQIETGIGEETGKLKDQDARAIMAGGRAAMSEIHRRHQESHRLRDPDDGLQGVTTPMAVIMAMMAMD